MMLGAAVAACLALAGFPAAATADPGGGGQSPPPEVLPRTLTEMTFSYGSDAAQRLDAYWQRRPTSGGRPGIVILHGGYWLAGDKRAWRDSARQLAVRGYAVFSVNYRLTSEATWPAQFHDARAALAYIRRGARRFQLDVDRIVVLGSSAGGQLATMLGTYGVGADRVRGVVALSAPSSPYLAHVRGTGADATSRQRKLRLATERLVGCRPRPFTTECWARLERAASVNYAGRGDTPMLLLHSRDDFVPVQHSTELSSALRAAGVAVTVHALPGLGHGGRMLFDPGVFAGVAAWIGRVVSVTSA